MAHCSVGAKLVRTVLRPPLQDQEVSSVTVIVDYKEIVVRNPLDHMKKQQLEKFKSHMEKQQIEKLEREKLERQQIEELERQQIEELARQHTEEVERQQNEKFQRYAVEGRRYLMSKYFSDKTIFGGDIFEVKTTKDGQTTKMSRFPGYQSYADPANFNDDSSSKSNSTGNIFDGKKTTDGEATKVRFPGSRSHAGPASSNDDDSGSESMSF